MKSNTQVYWILLVTLGLYFLFFFFNQPVDFTACQLCDGKQYLKLYWFFEEGTVSQITYPFYTRPLVPLLASLLPGSNPDEAFHIINCFFVLLSVFIIHRLWCHLQISKNLQWVGFGWLLLHWTGIIRYNLFDYITVDVPLYFFQVLALLLFFKKKYQWFYLITPLAILQKESFIGIASVLIFAHILESKTHWFKEGQHLLYSLVFGIALQYLILEAMPNQNHVWHPLLTIMLLAKMTIDDPTRIIRWFAAFGSAFGAMALIPIFKLKTLFRSSQENSTLVLLSILYGGFGLLAGEDMTRILFLGFPFIMTLSLISFKSESIRIILAATVLSLPALRILSLPIQNQWGVDYANLNFVYSWAGYYAITFILFFILCKISIRKKQGSINLR